VAALTDEILMAYADSVLDKDTAARVEVLLHQDPEARRLVDIYRITGTPISNVFEAKLEEPVPAHLVNFVLEYGAEKPASPANRWTGKLMAFRDWLVPQTQAVSWQFAAASAAALVVGTGAGWVLHGALTEGPDQRELAAMTQGQILAKGSLQEIFDSTPSGQDVRIAGWVRDSTVIRVDFTFKNTSGGYCREYQMAVPGSGNFAGLACRSANGPWAVEMHLPQGGKADSPVIAGPVKMLDPLIERVIDGDALGRKDEDEVIARGWK
jgi:surface antigen